MLVANRSTRESSVVLSPLSGPVTRVASSTSAGTSTIGFERSARVVAAITRFLARLARAPRPERNRFVAGIDAGGDPCDAKEARAPARRSPVAARL
jgi:hypothetical protein